MAVDTAGAAEQPAGTIRDALAAAFEEHSAPDTGAAAADTGSAAAADTGAADPAGGQPRDASGRFSAKAAEEAAAAAAADPTKTAADPKTKPEGEPAAADPKAATAPGETPQHWSAEDKALIAALPPEHRAAVVERFKKMEAGFTPRLQRAAELERTWGETAKIFEPHRSAMQQTGWTEQTLIKAWADTEQALMSGGEMAERTVAAIAKAYKVDLAKLAGVSAAPAAQPGAAAVDPGAADNPALKPILDELAAVKAKLGGFEQQQTQAATARQQDAERQKVTEIQAFADAKGEDGRPSHPHFADVAADMVTLVAAERQAGRVPNLQDLYDRAVWGNPATRAKQTAALEAAAVAKAKADAEKAQRDAAAAAKAKTDQARRAGSSVSGAPSSGGSGAQANKAATGRASLRDTIAAAVDEHA